MEENRLSLLFPGKEEDDVTRIRTRIPSWQDSGRLQASYDQLARGHSRALKADRTGPQGDENQRSRRSPVHFFLAHDSLPTCLTCPIGNFGQTKASHPLRAIKLKRGSRRANLPRNRLDVRLADSSLADPGLSAHLPPEPPTKLKAKKGPTKTWLR